jgi:hypothetical protein
MRKLLVITALLLFSGVTFGQTLKKSVVVGTFDSRAIAIAYYRTEATASYFEGLKTEHAEAEASGDKERVKELEAEGEASQKLIHKQGFGTWPVDNILETIKGKIPEIAKQADVDLIISKWNIVYQRSGVEFIDVTDVMVKLFNPDEQILEIIEQLKKQDPVPLEELENGK